MRRGWRGAVTRLRDWLAPRALVLMYHRIATPERDPWQLSVSPQHFAEHLDVIRRHGAPMAVRTLTSHLAAGRVPPGAVVVTLDDGYADNLHAARPLLERADVPATVFVAAAYLGERGGFWWDELERLILAPDHLPAHLRLRVRDEMHELALGAERHPFFLALYRLLRPLTDAERRRALGDLAAWGRVPGGPDGTARPLTVAEARALATGGLVEIGAHTLTHPQLSAIPAAAQQEEIRRSRAVLTEITGQDVTSFAYPYGDRADYTPDTVRLVAEAGFSSACATVRGVVRPTTPRFEIPRWQVTDCDGDQLGRRLAHWAAGA